MKSPKVYKPPESLELREAKKFWFKLVKLLDSKVTRSQTSPIKTEKPIEK
jgi:hypothetical protein